MLMVFVNVGVMLSYITGKWMAFHHAPYVMMCFPIAVFLSFFFYIPDTPMSLLNRRKPSAAIEKSLKFYLNISDKDMNEHNQKRFDDALQSIRDTAGKKILQPRVSRKDLSKYFKGFSSH